MTTGHKNKQKHSLVIQLLLFFVFVVMPCVQATVSIDGIAYDSVPFDFGKSFDNSKYDVNLFVAPSDYLCTDDLEFVVGEDSNRLLYSHPSAAEISITNINDEKPSFNVMNSEENSESSISSRIQKRNSVNIISSIHRETSEVYPIALIAFEGVCSFEQKAHNAAKLNSKYSKYNGPQIQYLIFVTNENNVNDVNSNDDDAPSIDTDFRIVSITKYFAAKIIKKMQKSFTKNKRENRDYYLTENAFLPPSQNDANDWFFLVTIDGQVAGYPSAHISNIHFILGVVVALPAMLYLCLICLSRRIHQHQTRNENDEGWSEARRDHWMEIRRDQLPRTLTELPPGISNNNTDFFLRILMLLADDEYKNSGLLTQDQIEALPNIEYGVTDIEAICQYRKKKNLSKTCTTGLTKAIPGTDNFALEAGTNDETDSENWATSKYLQDAYSTHTSCSICINEFTYKEKLVLLPQCGHFFHRECIKPWLKDRKGSCPLCQTFVSPDCVVKLGNTEDLNVRPTANNAIIMGEEEVRTLRNESNGSSNEEEIETSSTHSSEVSQ